jgi:hypothetical protein
MKSNNNHPGEEKTFILQADFIYKLDPNYKPMPGVLNQVAIKEEGNGRQHHANNNNT